ncbi:SURF1 family protein [Sphingopyxis indica]|uniref:SURF1-like protein n=1 Tax=Sphingopyxis indica TaxID=436663 RepID=A0A239D9L3_9SPHN|nr:SURF1 family protein [Sphingopyxis indica]SNS28343.1 surfeit locus 1 family protein [Sphingopyxis indica]
MKRALLTTLALLFAAGFVALGVWQVERRAWKHDLIAAVDARIHAAPVAAPGPAAWPKISAEKDAYRRIRATGRFRHDKSVLVKAVTDLGGGYWLLTPLETPAFTLFVNRGFVPQDKRNAVSRPEGSVTVTGLLRISEPGGAFLRANDPGAGRWYSRDVAAIAEAEGLGRVAPYFIDSDAAPQAKGYPVGGLTVVHFPDNHLVYALTWFALALLCLFFAWRLWRQAPLRSNMGG